MGTLIVPNSALLRGRESNGIERTQPWAPDGALSSHMSAVVVVTGKNQEGRRCPQGKVRSGGRGPCVTA